MIFIIYLLQFLSVIIITFLFIILSGLLIEKLGDYLEKYFK